MQELSLHPRFKNFTHAQSKGTLQKVGRRTRGNSIIFFFNLDSRAYAFMHSIRALISSVICVVYNKKRLSRALAAGRDFSHK